MEVVVGGEEAGGSAEGGQSRWGGLERAVVGGEQVTAARGRERRWRMEGELDKLQSPEGGVGKIRIGHDI